MRQEMARTLSINSFDLMDSFIAYARLAATIMPRAQDEKVPSKGKQRAAQASREALFPLRPFPIIL